MKKAILAIYNYLKTILITFLFSICLLSLAIFVPHKVPEFAIDTEEEKPTKKKK